MRYALWRWALKWLRNNPRRCAIRELKLAFEHETKQRKSGEAWRKAVLKLKSMQIITIERYEQLYLTPIATFQSQPSILPNRDNRNLATIETTIEKSKILSRSIDGLNIERPSISEIRESPDPTSISNRASLGQGRIHSAHKMQFAIAYRGNQPEGGSISYFGRYRTIRRVVFRVRQNLTIVAYKRKLHIWVHYPKGITTEEQIVEARGEGVEALKEFEKQQNIALEGDISGIMMSHHVVEDLELNSALKPVLEQFGPEIEQRTGTKICKTSHPGKVEHEGKNRDLLVFPDISSEDRVLKGNKVARGLEKLSDFYDEYKELSRKWDELEEQINSTKAELEAEGRISRAESAKLAEGIGLILKVLEARR